MAFLLYTGSGGKWPEGTCQARVLGGRTDERRFSINVVVFTRSQRMPLSEAQRAAMDLHLQKHTCYTTVVPLGTVSVRTYKIDSIERIMDSNSTHVRSLALHNSCIVCSDTAEFWYRLAILASGTEKVGWHAIEYG